MWSLLKSLRVVAWIEGITYLLLFVTMPLKYAAEIAGPNYVVGMFHGVFFIMYVGLVMVVSFQDQWNRKTTFLALLASLIPFGTFWAEKKLFRYDKLVRN